MSAATLDGRVVVVTGAERPLGAGLARALASAGATVRELEPPFDDRATVEDALQGVVDELGAIDVLVHGWIDDRALEPIAFEDVDDDLFEVVWETTMRATIACSQAVFAHLRGRGGRIVYVTPTVSMSGAPSLAAYTAAVEGQRLLAKSAARQWGPDGITVNCIAPAPELVGVSAGDVSLAAPALGGPGDAEADLGPVVVFLAGDASHFVTGVTLTADGGVWMSP